MQSGLHTFQRSLPLFTNYCIGLRHFRNSNSLFVAAGAPNHYQVLGLKPSCSDKDIKKSYFQLAKKYHPDLNPEESARI